VYLLYIDESGNPDDWQAQDNFVLAGVAVHEGQVRGFGDQLDAIQRRFFADIQVPIEFHAAHIRGGKDRFRGMQAAERESLLAAVYDVIGEAFFPNLILFATATHVSRVVSGPQALRDTLEDLCQRFNTFLVRQFEAGHIDKGLLILDRSGREGHIREAMASFRVSGTRYGHLGNIIDVPYFGDSRDTRMLQLADFTAYALGRYFNRGDAQYLDRVLPRFDRRSQRGERVGLRHLIGHDFQCECMVCVCQTP